MTISNNQKAVVHIAAGQIGLEKDAYRDALYAHAGVRSAKDLDYKGFKAVMEHFEKSGFQGTQKKNRSQKRKNARPGMASEPQLKKIFALWFSMPAGYYDPGKEFDALRGFLKKRFGVEHENFLKFKTAHKVIEALKSIVRRG